MLPAEPLSHLEDEDSSPFREQYIRTLGSGLAVTGAGISEDVSVVSRSKERIPTTGWEGPTNTNYQAKSLYQPTEWTL